MKKIIAAIAATGLLATPVLAQSVNVERAPARSSDSNELEGESGILIALLAAAAIIAGIIILADNEDDLPTSP